MPSTKTPRTPRPKPKSNDDVFEVVTTAPRPSRLERAAESASKGYDNLSKQYPTTKFVLDSLPVTGQIASGLDTANSMYKGDYGSAAVDALGILPGGGIAKKIRSTYKGLKKAPVKELEYLKQGLNNVQQLDRVGDAKTYMDNVGPEKNYARGGMVKSRGNGIAQRGKTKGRMR